MPDRILPEQFVFLVDTNLLSYACSSPNGAVISQLNTYIEKIPVLRSQRHTTFALTPFSLLEALGIVWPTIEVEPSKTLAASDAVSDVIARANEAYLHLPMLQSVHLRRRAEERRAYIDPAAHQLFDACVTWKATDPETPKAIAKSLAYDHAFKSTYPPAIRKEVRRFLITLMLARDAMTSITMFRIAKFLWDGLMTTGQKLQNPAHREEIAAVNKSMRLKTIRDFLDCDLIHFACFGWHPNKKVVAFTCDSPDVILQRVAVYKGTIQSAIGITEGVPPEMLPKLNPGLFIRCDPDGTITHVIPVETVPLIM